MVPSDPHASLHQAGRKHAEKDWTADVKKASKVVADLDQIWRYTASRWSPEQADEHYRDPVATMEALAAGSKSGRACNVRDGYFQYPVNTHVVFYQESALTLDVIRVLHQRMDVERQL